MAACRRYGAVRLERERLYLRRLGPVNLTVDIGALVPVEYSRGYTGAMKTEISIPDSIFHETEAMARRLGMSTSELFRRAVEEYMESHRHDAVREALDAVYAEESDALDSTLADMQFASIPEEDW